MNLKSDETILSKASIFVKRIVAFIKNLAISIVLFINNKIFIPIKNAFIASLSFIKKRVIDKLFLKLPDRTKQEEYSENPAITTEAQWKLAALEDFKLWLSEIPSEEPPAMTATPDTCDIYTMLSEFIALRQEIKMQNREQNRTVNALNSVKGVTDEYGEIYTLFKEKTNQIAQLEQNIRMSSEKKSVSYFFDVRDSLERGYRASVDMANKKGLFWRPPKDIHTICEGYEMAISRFDKALSMMDIEPIQTDNMPFNPETMKVVETRDVVGIENGTVIETISSGFVRGSDVLRFAKVIVAKTPNAE
ncbi:MAG: nucleotide exchange factor GrpE [Desulfamplus sp.]|nr:nucleotide exchange factor GrpE [Desulfamplus sp.]MBF0390991.1 nucleotide exchange factor GrpE [Desulfamplus sp.]